MEIVVIGLSHHSSPVELRERFAFDHVHLPATLQRMRDELKLEGAVILSTCNRVEIYAATEGDAQKCNRDLVNFLYQFHDCDEQVDHAIYQHAGSKGVEHLFKVASGLDSMVLGETEILGQLKDAYHLALEHRHTGGHLNKVFQRAFNVAKHIRTETLIQRGSVSVGSVAVELAEKIFESLKDSRVMVIGAGDTSEKTARFLAGRGAKEIFVTNRSYEKAMLLAESLKGQSVPFDEWDAYINEIDIIISSTSAPNYVIDRKRLEALMRLRGNRPLLLIDIAVPRDIDPEVNMISEAFLYNIDDLQAIAQNYLRQRQEEVSRCEAIIKEKATALINSRPMKNASESGEHFSGATVQGGGPA